MESKISLSGIGTWCFVARGTRFIVTNGKQNLIIWSARTDENMTPVANRWARPTLHHAGMHSFCKRSFQHCFYERENMTGKTLALAAPTRRQSVQKYMHKTAQQQHLRVAQARQTKSTTPFQNGSSSSSGIALGLADSSTDFEKCFIVLDATCLA